MARNKVHSGARAKVHTGAAEAEIAPTPENPNPQLGSGKNTIVERALDATGDGKLIPTPLKGGSYGIIPEAEQRVTFHAGSTQRRDAVPARKPKTWIITDGPRNAQGRITFVYDHQRVSVGYGKEVTENTYDIDLLRRQGVKLEEVVDPLGDAQAAQLAEVTDPDRVAEVMNGANDDVETNDDEDEESKE